MRLYRVLISAFGAAALAGCHADRATGLASPAIQSRVAYRLNASPTRPLIILDGQRIPANADFQLGRPEDIDKIEVLKGNAARSAYGIDGANGVILVTTKRR